MVTPSAYILGAFPLFLGREGRWVFASPKSQSVEFIKPHGAIETFSRTSMVDQESSGINKSQANGFHDPAQWYPPSLRVFGRQ